MAQRPRFTLPATLKLDVTPDGIVIEFPGDVEIEQDLGFGVQSIVASGDLTIKLASVNANLRCGGTLRVLGDVLGGQLHGREVLLGEQTIQCVSISADHRLVMGAADITADALIAPELHLDPEAHGRVTVIESLNDPGATKIKGGFSVLDYDDMFGNADAFLSQRGLSPLGAVAPPAAPPRSAAEPYPAPLTDELEEPTGPRIQPAPVRSTPPLPSRSPPEDEEDPLSLSLDELEPMVAVTPPPEPSPPPPKENPKLQRGLEEALGRIVRCYEGAELPPSVRELRELVEEHNYDGLRASITDVWNGLLTFHQRRGIRPHHSVTHAFNVIHQLVQT